MLTRVETATRAARDASWEKAVRLRLLRQGGNKPAFTTSGVWHSLDPATGGELTLEDLPEREVRPAIEGTVKPNRLRNSMLNNRNAFLRVSEMFTATSRREAHEQRMAEWNIRHKLHINLPQPTLEQCWNQTELL